MAMLMRVERIKKQNDLVTYRELVAYSKGEPIDRNNRISQRAREHRAVKRVGSRWPHSSSARSSAILPTSSASSGKGAYSRPSSIIPWNSSSRSARSVNPGST